MRLRQISFATAVSVVAGIATASVGLSSGQAWAESSTQLQISNYSHMVVDPVHQHIFFSPGSGGSSILVTDYSGKTISTITGQAGAVGLAISSDDGRVYAALSGADAISSIDTSTLSASVIPTQVQPEYIAYTEGKVWFSYNDTTAHDSGIGSVDPGTSPATVKTGQTAGPNWASAPMLAASANGVLAAVQYANDPTDAATYDVSTVPVTTKARGDLKASGGSSAAFFRDVSLAPDGTEMVLGGCGDDGCDAHARFRTSDLSPDGTYPSGSYPYAAAVAPDGHAAVGSSRGVWVYQPGGSTAVNTYATGASPAGLAWDPDGSRLFVVVNGYDALAGAYDTNLYVLTDPEIAASTLTLTGPTGSPLIDQPLTLKGTLSSGTSVPAGTVVQVSRTNTGDGSKIRLADASTDTNGAFTVTDAPSEAGSYAYTASFAGDAAHQASTVTLGVEVIKYSSALTLSAPAAVHRGGELVLSGRLTSAGPIQGASVSLLKRDLAHPAGRTIATVAVGAGGMFAFRDAPQIGGPTSYTVTFAGDGTHTPSSASRLVQVSRVAAAVAVSTSGSVFSYGGWVKITAHLGATYNSRVLSIYAQPYGGSRTLVRTGTVDKYGNLTAWYKLSFNTWITAVFSGDYRTAPAGRGRTAYTRVQIEETTGDANGLVGLSKINGQVYKVFKTGRYTNQVGIDATVIPGKPGECAYLTAQGYYSGAWHTEVSTGCEMLDMGSMGGTLLDIVGTPTGQLFRWSAQYRPDSTDNTNVTSSGPWQYFTFRN